jgi:hypothetical protein
MTTGGFPRFAEIMWVRIPRAASRRSLSVGVALADGAWLQAWPRAAALSPIGSLSVGASLAFLRPDPTYSRSLIVLVLLTALPGIGGGIGAWEWAGYVIVDFVANHPNANVLPNHASLAQRFWHLDLPLGLSYAVLGFAMIMLPVAATGIRIQTIRTLHIRGSWATKCGAVLQGLLFGIGLALWAQAAAFINRPLWTFLGRSPDNAAIHALQRHAMLLGIVGGAIAATKTIVASEAWPRVSRPPVQMRDALRADWRWWATVPIRAGFLTLLVSGLIRNTLQGTVTFLVLLGVFSVRAALLNHFNAYVTAVNKIPLLLRLVAVCLSASFAGNLIVKPALRRGESSFVSMLVVVAASSLVGALVIPPPARPTPPAQAPVSLVEGSGPDWPPPAPTSQSVS